MNKGILFALMLGMCVVTPVWAQDTGSARSGMSLQDAINAGRKTAQDGKPDYNKIFNKNNAQGAVPHQENNEKSSFWQDASNSVMGIIQAGGELLMTCMSGGEGPNDQLRCEVVRMLMKTKEKKAAREELVKPDDPLVLMRDLVMKDPEAIAGNWAGEYSDCEETTVDIGGDFEYRVCSDVIPVGGVEEDVCTLGENVILDPGTLYQCNRTIAQLGVGQCSVGNTLNMDAAQVYQCGFKPENRETVPCETTRKVALGDKCVDQAITGRQGNMESSLTAKGGGEYLLTFGKKGDNYWTGNPAQVYDRTLTFTINNLQALGVFSAIKVEYDDWLQIKVNGTQVFNGPKGGDRLEFNGQCRYEGSLNLTSTGIERCQYCEGATFPLIARDSKDQTCNTYFQNYTTFRHACPLPVVGSCNVPHYLERRRYTAVYPVQEFTKITPTKLSTVVGPSGIVENVYDYSVARKYGLVSYSATGTDLADQKTSHSTTVNVNLIRYLKEGVNTITTRTIVGDGGETYIEFLIRTMCDDWDDGCASLGTIVSANTP
jgi:hypothetical protein